jgi:cytochrome c-type biogenesis protein CcmH
MPWILFAFLTVAVVATLFYPLWKPSVRPRRSAYDKEVFKAQLREVELDAERGTLPPEEAGAAKLEIERRLLRADRAQETGAEDMSDKGSEQPPAGLETWARRLVVPMVIAAVLFGSFLVYGRLGSPHMPDMPLDDRQEAATPNPERLADDLNSLEEKLAARLAVEPDDGDGWRLLGRARQELGRYGEAAAAYARAAEIQPQDGDLRAYEGETLVFEAEGTVTPRARAAFDAALRLDPEIPAARYYLGLAHFQAGEYREAYDRWLSLARASGPAAPWLADLQKDLNRAAKAAGIEPEQVAHEDGSVGPTAQDMVDADALSDEERTAFVAGMIERLAEKLRENPDDADGWIRLGRAKTVLGDFVAAADAFGKAAELRPDDLAAQLDNAHAGFRTVPEGLPVPDSVLTAFARVHVLDPKNFDGLWFTGLQHVHAGNRDQARVLWESARDVLASDDPRREMVAKQLKDLTGR